MSPIMHGDVPGGRQRPDDTGNMTFESGILLLVLLVVVISSAPPPSEVSGISLTEKAKGEIVAMKRRDNDAAETSLYSGSVMIFPLSKLIKALSSTVQPRSPRLISTAEKLCEGGEKTTGDIITKLVEIIRSRDQRDWAKRPVERSIDQSRGLNSGVSSALLFAAKLDEKNMTISSSINPGGARNPNESDTSSASTFNAVGQQQDLSLLKLKFVLINLQGDQPSQ
ncbi:hypothetical protein DKX38_007538 [Salix brachista]|uniref:BURP domain-containing protein n=1 Tax=Salix brachista TaxID=2182728 RepID=A0A5N5MNI3_9ROSI|nr:hypothetical protein DKX38_007538 [Salix brachista]